MTMPTQDEIDTAIALIRTHPARVYLEPAADMIERLVLRIEQLEEDVCEAYAHDHYDADEN